MVAQSIASKSRRPHHEPDDALLSRAVEVAGWIRKHATAIAIVGGLLVVLLLGLFWYRSDRARREEDAAIAFLPVEQAVLSGDPAVAGRELELFIQRHEDTAYAQEARILLAQVHLRGGKTAEAIAALEGPAEDLESPLGPQAALLLAAAQEAAGETEAALQTYTRIAEGVDNDFRREQALVGAARLREASGDFAGAAEIYGQLIELVGTTEAGSLYEMRQAEAQAKVTAQ